MKFTVEREQLNNALGKVQTVVEKRNTVQILSNILCEVSKDTLSLSTTDLEVGIKVKIPAKVSEEGRITLSAKHFVDIVKELPNKPVNISSKKNNWIELSSGTYRSSIVSLSADEYPKLPIFEEKEYSSARTEALANMIDRTLFAVSTDTTRYHLNGVFFESVDKNVMRMTATDGHRLSFVDQEIFKIIPEIKRGIIIPRKGLSELRRLLDEDGDSVNLSFERGYVFAEMNDTYLFIRLIEGEYPDYKQVIPKEVDLKALINREDFTAAVKRVSVLANQKSRGVKLEFSKNTLVISSNNPDMGEANEQMNIDYDGKKVEIGFNANYMLDCLPVIKSDTLVISFKDHVSPGILQGKEEKNHTYVIMPMRI